MYEARQNKEKVSRRIDAAGGMTRQRVILKSKVLQKEPIFTYTAKNKVKPDEKLKEIRNFERKPRTDDEKKLIAKDSGWSKTGEKQYVVDKRQQEVIKCNHSFAAKRIKDSLCSQYIGEKVKYIIAHNERGTSLLNETRNIGKPVLEEESYKTKDVTDYVNEGMQLIIEYSKNLFVWPMTQGDADFGKDDEPKLWFSDEVSKDKVDLTGWESEGWRKEHLGERYMQLNSVKSNLSRAKQKLQEVLKPLDSMDT